MEMAKKAKTSTITVKLVRSLIGSKKDQIATANSLGLRKIGDTTCQPDNAATQGKVTKISHLVEVTEA
jgi:large subunit ribosomal protein L30